MSFLPHELGEPGALRVSAFYGETRVTRQQSLRNWLLEEFGSPDPRDNPEARALRAVNQQKFNQFLARLVRPSRVST